MEEFYKRLAELRGEMIAALKLGNWPKYGILVKEEDEWVNSHGAPDKVADLSLRDFRKQNLSDALKAITKAVEAVLE